VVSEQPTNCCSVAGVVRVARENCKCAVELLGEDETGEGVGERERAEGEQEGGALAGGVGPSAGGADGEEDVLLALIAALPEPCGEGLGRKLAAAAIEKNNGDGSAAMPAIKPFEERVFSSEGLGLASGELGAAVEVKRGESLKGVSRSRARTDVGDGELHGGELYQLRLVMLWQDS
jgi:hypothetical protein